MVSQGVLEINTCLLFRVLIKQKDFGLLVWYINGLVTMMTIKIQQNVKLPGADIKTWRSGLLVGWNS